MAGQQRLQSISYHFLYSTLYVLSLLPFPVLYLMSDGVCFLLYRVLGYRKNVVFKNLRNAFPDKSQKEIDQLARSFYRYLCDLFLETFKTLSISRASMLRHCAMDPEAVAVFKDLAERGQSVI